MDTRPRNNTRTADVTDAQADEDRDLAQFCHAAAVRLFTMLDRDEAEAGLTDPYSPRLARKGRSSKKPVVKHGGEKSAADRRDEGGSAATEARGHER